MAQDDRKGMAVMFTSNDVKKSTDYYTEVLGFDMKECWPNSEEPMWANLMMEGQSIMVGSAPDLDKIGECCGGDAAKEAYAKQA